MNFTQLRFDLYCAAVHHKNMLSLQGRRSYSLFSGKWKSGRLRCLSDIDCLSHLAGKMSGVIQKIMLTNNDAAQRIVAPSQGKLPNVSENPGKPIVFSHCLLAILLLLYRVILLRVPRFKALLFCSIDGICYRDSFTTQ